MNKSLIFLCILLFLLSIVSLFIGVYDFSLKGLLSGDLTDLNLIIISRLPRLFGILITGASLSIAGLIMQTITNNKFVSPTTIGMMEWAKFGIMISIVCFGDQNQLTKICIAFAFTLFGTLLFMQIMQNLEFQNKIIIPLMGIMLGSIVSSITVFVSYKFEIIQNIESWMQGSFSLVIKGRYELLYLGIPFLILAYLYANKFIIAGLGKNFSANLGLNHKKVILVGIIISSVISACIVTTIGSIPFIGLVVPNIISIFMGDNIKNTLPLNAICGALFVLICDILARVLIYPYEISISVIISIIGSAIFLGLILRGNRG
ncbi:iron chelate uptake ABC transporter family permease subunit [Campylobacter sp. FMV-PI01]|uniref:Iron chelate uptake ABC transporter family permease subunit n=1 Tax=Campylobacter portucalensis TaxID=2608384 RepID=A0A6L5WJF4_9BACT|nr:iron chelate uptake ABC transporter family permease subunit [Campylobacter portucalensis]MSN97076.1 iron chelate uptake ABC transporter family permease subunit [Campylobacter portucalensis]